jgi:hypothetical protein
MKLVRVLVAGIAACFVAAGGLVTARYIHRRYQVQSLPLVSSRRDPFSGPLVYKDPDSGTILYVESDRRHVASITRDGTLHWNRDPFKDDNLPLYRTNTPKIVYIGPVESKSIAPAPGEPKEYVWIVFNSSQFGALRIGDGYFEWLGQN